MENLYGTPRKACKPLQILVHPERFERPTYGTGIRRSLQLSYGCMEKDWILRKILEYTSMKGFLR